MCWGSWSWPPRMTFCGSLEHVGTQNLLPGNLLQLFLLHVRCGGFCRRGPASRSSGRHGTDSVHYSGVGGVLLFPYTPGLLPGRRMGRNAAQRLRAASQICALHSCSLLALPACLGNSALALSSCGLLRQPRGGPGTRDISVLSSSLHLQGHRLSPGASHWAVVTASFLASPFPLPSNLFSRQLPGGAFKY